jgi:hypothetical protein
MRILITGAGGAAAISVWKSLSAGHELHMADMDPLAAGLYLVPPDRRLIIPRVFLRFSRLAGSGASKRCCRRSTPSWRRSPRRATASGRSASPCRSRPSSACASAATSNS